MMRVNRRQFLREAVGVMVGTAFGSELLSKEGAGAENGGRRRRKESGGRKVGDKEAAGTKHEQTRGKSRVVVVRDERVRDKSNRTNAGVVRSMLEAGLMRLTGAKSAEDALGQLFEPTDVVGIKVNCIAGPSLDTDRALVAVIAELLQNVGIKPKNIIVWDRLSNELARSGFRINKNKDKDNDGVRCFGTDAVGYDTEVYTFGKASVRLSNILSKLCTALINVPVLKTHGIAGVSISLKNHLGSISKPSQFHPNRCVLVADVNGVDPIRYKSRLIICDALRPLYNEGPGDNPMFRFNYNALIVATDPVALDSVGLKILEEQRRKHNPPLPPISNVNVPSIERAEDLELGIAELAKIATDWLVL